MNTIMLWALIDLRLLSVLRSVYLWIKGSVKSRAFLLRRDASSSLPSGAAHGLFYPEIPPPQYLPNIMSNFAFSLPKYFIVKFGPSLKPVSSSAQDLRKDFIYARLESRKRNLSRMAGSARRYRYN